MHMLCMLLQTKLLHMEEVLAKGLVGQDEAIAVISKCIRLSRAGLRYHDRPLGVFLMIGPTVRHPLHYCCTITNELELLWC